MNFSARTSTRLAGVIAAVMLVFAAGPASSAVAATVVVRPASVPAGTVATFSVSGFAADTRTQLLVGPPNSEAEPMSALTTNGNGAGSVRVQFPRTATPGRYVVVACQRGCRTKATRSFTITKPLLTAAQAIAKVRAVLQRNADACDMTWTTIRAVAVAGMKFRVTAQVSTFGNPGPAQWTVNRRNGVTTPYDQLAFEIGTGCI